MNNKQPIATVVQITDSHLFSQANGELLGINTLESFKQVVGLVKQIPDIDLLLVTGDIAQESSREAYATFARYTDHLAKSVRWLPGNHDELLRMQSYCRDNNYLQSKTVLGNWLILSLNSHVQHKPHGMLADLRALEQTLAAVEQDHVLIGVHHHCLAMGSQWLDQINMHNADEFLACIKQFPKVKVVTTGHVHQYSDQLQDGIRFLTTPSTCVQFMPWSEDFQVDTQQPGFRYFYLYADGRVDTGIKRLPEGSFLPDENSGGY